MRRPALALALTALLALACRDTPHHHDPVIMGPDEGDVYWMAPESADHLGSGGELRIYVDPETHPHATASFAKFTLGAGGALPVHRHDKTEEFATFVSGEGVAVFVDDDGVETEVRVAPGHVWYSLPGRWHAVRNPGAEPLALVFATVPNEKEGLLSVFRRIGAAHDMTLWDPDGE